MILWGAQHFRFVNMAWTRGYFIGNTGSLELALYLLPSSYRFSGLLFPYLPIDPHVSLFLDNQNVASITLHARSRCSSIAGY